MGGDLELVLVGRIVRPHGVRGDLKVLPLTDWPERFESLTTVHLKSVKENCRKVKIQNVRFQKNGIILKLAEVDNIDTAEMLRGYELYVSPDQIPPLPEGYVHLHDLIGLKVLTDSGEIIGEVTDILKIPAHDVYVVSLGEKEILIPAVKQFVKSVDLEKGEVIITPIEGLLD